MKIIFLSFFILLVASCSKPWPWIAEYTLQIDGENSNYTINHPDTSLQIGEHRFVGKSKIGKYHFACDRRILPSQREITVLCEGVDFDDQVPFVIGIIIDKKVIKQK